MRLLSIPLLALTLSAALLIVEVPYVIAHGTVLPFADKLEEIETSRIARPEMQPMLDAWHSASQTFPDPRLKADFALVEMVAARLDLGATDETWQHVAIDMTAALKVRSLDPFTWARLSYVQSRLNQPEAARESLEQSFATGRYIPGFMVWRYTHALTLWDGMSEAQRTTLGDQTGLLWRKKKWDLIKLGRLAPFSSQIETLMRTYQQGSAEDFLRRRKPLPTVGYGLGE